MAPSSKAHELRSYAQTAIILSATSGLEIAICQAAKPYY